MMYFDVDEFDVVVIVNVRLGIGGIENLVVVFALALVEVIRQQQHQELMYHQAIIVLRNYCRHRQHQHDHHLLLQHRLLSPHHLYSAFYHY